MAIAATGIYTERIFCSTARGVGKRWASLPFDAPRGINLCGMRDTYASIGLMQHNLLSVGRTVCLWKVWIASDYSDLVPDPSDRIADRGYHPLEEVMDDKRGGKSKLTAAEMARSTLEPNTSGLLVFTGMVHREPHDHISWTEAQYVVDDYGDLYFKISNDDNILQECQARNLVNALIGIDLTTYESRRIGNDYVHLGKRFDDVSIHNDYLELVDSEFTDMPEDWSIPDTSEGVHPLYFAKCITKAVNTEYTEKMDHPSYGVSIMGLLRPCFLDEEPYAKSLFHSDDCDDLMTSEDEQSFSSRDDGFNVNSTYYRLDILRIYMFSVYGIQYAVSLDDFLDAEPDALINSASAIMNHFDERGIDCNAALKSLCKRKGLLLEEANLIGIDSLGIDVRVLHGRGVQTYRFAFKVQASSERAAVKQMLQLLFPGSRMKKLRARACYKGDRPAESF